MIRYTTALTFILFSVHLALAQPRQAAPPLPSTGPAPLLYVQFAGGAGSKAVLYHGGTKGISFPAPVLVGLRPGYINRVELTNLPGNPGVALYPSFEVRGSLQLPAKVSAAEYPVPIRFSQEEIDHAVAGFLITKAIYLEDPEKAIPFASAPGSLPEMELRPGQDLLAEAGARGRTVLIVRVGGRRVPPEEMQLIPGTVLLPGAGRLAPPPIRPLFPCVCPAFDPILGPRPLTEECFHDGGDAGLPAVIGPDGQLRGVEPADTVAGYKDSQGRVHVTPSNRVDICAPRFEALRIEVPPAGYEVVTGPGNVQGREEKAQTQSVRLSAEAHQSEGLQGLAGRRRASAAFSMQGPGSLLRLEVLTAHDVQVGIGAVLGTAELQRLTKEQRTAITARMDLARELSRRATTESTGSIQSGAQVVGQVRGVNVYANVQEVHEFTAACNKPPVVALDRPLILQKCTDVTAAKVGDVVTFYLKYSNVGGQPISDIAVSDSLTSRLEYVPGSARSDRDSVFTMQQNEAGSLLLHWELTGKLLPGESGLVTFQAKVR
jgi:uncharacterized repeat protein (TIGR01451 family)